MKKILYCFFAICICLCVLNTAVAAQELSTELEPTKTEESIATEHTLLSRLQEAWENGTVVDAAVILWGAINTIALLIANHSGKVSSDKLKNTMRINTKTSNDKTDELVNATNTMETSITGLSQNVERILPQLQQELQSAQAFDAKQIELLRQSADRCVAAVGVFAEMMQTIYSGSKTLPQPTKNLVNEKYLKILQLTSPAVAEEGAGRENAEQ